MREGRGHQCLQMNCFPNSNDVVKLWAILWTFCMFCLQDTRGEYLHAVHKRITKRTLSYKFHQTETNLPIFFHFSPRCSIFRLQSLDKQLRACKWWPNLPNPATYSFSHHGPWFFPPTMNSNMRRHWVSFDTFLPQARMIQSKIDTFHRNAWWQALKHLLSSKSCSQWAIIEEKFQFCPKQKRHTIHTFCL